MNPTANCLLVQGQSGVNRHAESSQLCSDSKESERIIAWPLIAAIA